MAKENTYEFLMLGSLGEMELQKLQTKQVAVYKSKLNSRVSLQKGNLLLALIALEKMKTKKFIA
jgi:hypothetical protein